MEIEVTAFRDYALAREQVLELVKDANGRWTPFFRALTHFEIAVSQLYVALASVGKVSKHRFVTPGDGSFEERLNLIHNASKHELAAADLPVWFTNEGLKCSKSEVSFVEIEGFMLNMAGVVKALCDRKVAIEALQS